MQIEQPGLCDGIAGETWTGTSTQLLKSHSVSPTDRIFEMLSKETDPSVNETSNKACATE